MEFLTSHPPDLVTPKVTVIIPAYNQARYLPDAIHSVLAQTYRDFEILIVDDGSTDETPVIAQRYGTPVRYFRQSNQGLAGARNTGIREARGEFIALLDSDDAWQPTFLERMLTLFDNRPDVDVAYCGWRYMDATGNDLPQAPTTRVFPSERMYWIMLRINVLNVCTILARRKRILEAGCFDAAFRRLEDWDLWLRLLKTGRVFVGTPEVLVRYRLHDSSLSRDPSAMQRAVQAVVEKQFGPDDGQWQGWPAEKRRAYGGVYRYHALSAIEYQGDWMACGQFLSRALQVDPSLADDLDLYYELALGMQPKGQRGTTGRLLVEQNGEKILGILQGVRISAPTSELKIVARKALASANRALGQVAYSAESYSLSRRYLLTAVRYRPGWVYDLQIVALLIKSFLGSGYLKRLRSWKRNHQLNKLAEK